MTKFVMPEMNRDRRDHYFYGPELDNAPALYDTEDTPLADKMVVAHFSLRESQWWIFECDPSTGEAFGYACLNGDTMNAEMGYIDLPALESLNTAGGNVIMRTTNWEPKPFGSCFPEDA